MAPSFRVVLSNLHFDVAIRIFEHRDFGIAEVYTLDAQLLEIQKGWVLLEILGDFF